MQRDLNIATVVFAFCSFVFFIIGCIGYSTDELTLKNTAWITVDDNGTKAWFNLANYYLKNGGVSDMQTYADFACNAPFCNECASTGDAAFGLIIVATVFAAFTTIISGILSSSPSAGLQIVNVVASFIASCFSLIGFGLFMGGCQFKVDDATPLDLHYGPGAIITLLGLLMMWLTVFFQIGAVAVGSK